MTSFNLQFEPEIKKIEKSCNWDSAAILAYQKWKEAPFNVNKLLCAGLQTWLGIIENEKVWLVSNSGVPFDSEKEVVMKNILKELAEWGSKYYHDNVLFNIYFGYLMDVMPYFFGDYTESQEKGKSMIQKAYCIESENPLVRAIYFRMVGETEKAANTCKEIWKIYSREQWGDSAVQDYFFRILNGELIIG